MLVWLVPHSYRNYHPTPVEELECFRLQTDRMLLAPVLVLDVVMACVRVLSSEKGFASPSGNAAGVARHFVVAAGEVDKIELAPLALAQTLGRRLAPFFFGDAVPGAAGVALAGPPRPAGAAGLTDKSRFGAGQRVSYPRLDVRAGRPDELSRFGL